MVRVVLVLLSWSLSVHLSRVGRLCPAVLCLHGVLDGISALVGSNVMGRRGCGEELPPVVASATVLKVLLLKVELLLLLELIRGRGSRIRFDGAPPVCIRRVKGMARTVVVLRVMLLLLNIA